MGFFANDTISARTRGDDLSRWKNYFVILDAVLLSASFTVFLVTGYTALYWAWVRSDLPMALPYLPWARNFGMLAMLCAAAAFGILFSSKLFPLPPKTRLYLSLLATVTVAFFSEFRNEGKFHLKTAVHFFGPGTWIHNGLNHLVSSLGDALYRIEYSHWNDFLMGPAIVCVLFPLVWVKIYAAFRDPGPISLSAASLGMGASQSPLELEQVLRFARIVMYVGLFWFFSEAWAEKAGYLSSPHSRDEIDLPMEFGGTMLGFWMARYLTKPFGKMSEKFSSTLLIDFLSSGVMGLFYTFIISALTENIAGAIGHALYPSDASSFDKPEYTVFQQHTRPFELLLVAGVMWWSLNRVFKPEGMTLLSSAQEPEAASQWGVPITIAKAFGAAACCLIVWSTMFSLIEPQGAAWALTTSCAGILAGFLMMLLVRRLARGGLTTLFGKTGASGK